MRRSSSLRSFLRLAAGSLLALHCGAADDVGSNESDHTAGEYIQENAIYAWAEPDHEAFEDLKNEGSRTVRQRLPDEHPAVLRFQQWLDRYDAAIRAKLQVRGQTLVAPKPKAIVYRDSTVNAWVFWFPVCLGAIGTEEAFAAGQPLSTSSHRVDREEVKKFGDLSKCLTPKNWAPDGAFAEWWNAKKPTCRLTPQAGPVSGFSVSGCSAARLGTELSRGEMRSAGSGIYGTTAIMSKLSENAFAMVVAHELSHYYRAHASSAYLEKYDFWYQRDVHEPKRPLPAEDAAALKDQIETLLSGRTFRRVPNQKLSPRTVSMFLSRVFTLAFLGLEEGCEDARDALQRGSFASVVPSISFSKEEQAQYLAFEEALLSCSEGVALTVSNREKFLLAATLWFDGEKSTSFVTTSTLRAFIDSVDAMARRYDANEIVLREHLNKNHIGWYTIEQEADDLAMELATMVGISPDEVIAGWLEAFRAFEDASPPVRENGSIGLDACKELYDNDFVQTSADGTKTDVYVPIGGTNNSHHTGCYRLFNFWREKNAHHYETAPAPEPFSPSWGEVQAAISSPGPSKDGGADGSTSDGGVVRDAGN